MFDDLFDTTLTYALSTKLGDAELTLRPLNGDNLPFVAEVLERERKRAAEVDQAGDAAPADAPVSVESMVAMRTREAADIHRWCFIGLTIGGSPNGPDGAPLDGLAFITALAVQAQSTFRDLVNFISATEKEAAPEALAGESSGG